MMQVGLFGESPYDSNAVYNLLSKHYANRFKFVKLSTIKDATILERTGKMQKLLEAEIESNPNISAIIFVRDLDSDENDKPATQRRLKWFEELRKPLPRRALLLLNVYELEALILADIETFNHLFHTSIKFKGDPMAQKDPKEFLQHQTRRSKRKFTVSENPEIFNHLDFGQVRQNCRYFKEFAKALEALDKSP